MLHTSDGKEYPYSLGQFGLIELALLRKDYLFGKDVSRIGDLTAEDVAEVLGQA